MPRRPASMVPLPTTPFSMLRDFVLGERGTQDGCFCPVCGADNNVKRYKLTRVHFRILQRLYQFPPEANVHWREFVDAGSATKMLNIPKHYGLIGQRTVNLDNPFDRSGEWHITDLGRSFVTNRCRLPYYFWSIHDHVLWWTDMLTTRAEMQERIRGRSARSLVEEMVRASLQRAPHTGYFQVEYL